MMTTDECPICLGRMDDSDHAYPIDCQTCQFNLCGECLKQLQSSSKDEYQEASDGSKQVKICLMCPQCRGKYQEQHVNDVLLLRMGYKVSILENNDESIHDSDLSASQLRMKQKVREHAMEIRDAHARYKKFHSEIYDEQMGSLVLERLEQMIMENQETTTTNDDNNNNNHKTEADVTLLSGLQDAMTNDEQIFVTQLLTSGNAEALAQAARILEGVLDLIRQGHSVNNNPMLRELSFSASQKQAQALQRKLKRHPLPRHMPLQVRVENIAGIIADKKTGKILRLKQGAGKLGLRKGDSITHIDDMPVEPKQVYETMQRYCCNDDTSIISLVVNANQVTADLLQERAKNIMADEQVS